MYVVYKHPSDYPRQYVVREHHITHTGVQVAPQPLAVQRTLALARKAIPWGLYRLPRHDDDDAVILETWL